jgi:hypothetical protein
MRQSPRPRLGSYEKIDIFLDKRTTIVHDMFSPGTAQDTQEATAEDCEGAPQSRSGGRQARIRMDEDKPRKRDTQLPGLGSAKRILAHKDRSPRRRDPCPPHGGRRFFWPPFARKPLIIIDSGKPVEIF